MTTRPNNDFTIRPITKFRPKSWKIATFDIETRPVGDESSLIAPFCLAATCEDAKGETLKYHVSPLSLVKHMLSRPKHRWYCHNGGHFDFKYFVADKDCQRWLAENGWSFELVGGSITKAVLFRKFKREIFVCDSFKLMSASLSALSKSFKVETPKGFIDFEKECFDPANLDHLEYLRGDVVSLFQVLVKYREILNLEFGIEPKLTASSTAFLAWRRTLSENVYRHNSKVSDFARKAYYGGRTECFAQGTFEDAIYIDVNSLYAFIMRDFGGLHDPYYTRSFDGPGFYEVEAEIDCESKFGYLPYRKPDGTGVIFPVGRFRTYATSLEIELAVERGAKVRVLQGWAFETWDKNLFKPFIERCSNLRQRDYKGGMGLCAKFLQNNLYGFFGMKPDRQRVIYSENHPEDTDNLVFSPLMDMRTGTEVPNFWETVERVDNINCVPGFAAWVTGAARTYLLRAILAEEDAGNRVLYCDTDSIILQGTPVSPICEGEYGAFKVEAEILQYLGVGNKTYAFVSADSNGYTLRCKGIPARSLVPEFFGKLLEGDKISVPFTQLSGIITCLKTGKMGYDGYMRTLPGLESISNRVPGNPTRPIKLEEW